ncbi:glycosyl transferase [Flavobacteriaceae bacterium LYZ1037]|nr:glycosyl transferase [Flavobacteriaceae bacterium LYZ1037]
MKSSLIISTYMWPEALELVLKSVLDQSVMPHEVLIADDGSNQTTKLLIEQFRRVFPIPLYHVWHEDTGFTKSVILNKTVAKTTGDYIIQVDGDCILHKHFIKDHIEFVSPNTFLYGSRVNIQEDHLDQLFNKQQIKFNILSQGIKKRTRAIHMPVLSLLYSKKWEVSKKFRGCNTSYFKSDFISVNGYDERFEGWGREDSELAWRFYNKGLSSRRLRYRGIVFHIYHDEKSRARLELNDDIEKYTIVQKLTWCENGVDKYL